MIDILPRGAWIAPLSERHGIAVPPLKQSIFQAGVPREERSVEAVTAFPTLESAVGPRLRRYLGFSFSDAELMQ